MKKILLIIGIAFCIFQMVVMATVITIGNENPTINQGKPAKTRVDGVNGASDTGIITEVKIYVSSALTALEIGIFTASGNDLTTRDNVIIGDVASTGWQTFSDLSLDVVAGDFIGAYWSAGTVGHTATGGSSWDKAGDHITCLSETFDPGDDIMGLYGTGTTVVGWDGPFNAQAITKWNNIEITVWNTIE